MNAKITIVPRRVNFQLSEVYANDINPTPMDNWLNDNRELTHLMNALSLTLPIGERFFIQSLRNVKHLISDEELKKDIKLFIAQEAIHGKEHEHYNALLEAQGYEIQPHLDRLEKTFELLHKYLPNSAQLALTCAIEHFTATLGSALIRNRKYFHASSPEFSAIWLWHAAEEVEHKAVCFDAYKKVGGGYLNRVFAILAVSVSLPIVLGILHSDIANQSRKTRQSKSEKSDIAGRWGILTSSTKMYHFLWGREGILKGTVKDYFQYYLPGFHPWQDDNSYLIDEWKAEYEEKYVVAKDWANNSSIEGGDLLTI